LLAKKIGSTNVFLGLKHYPLNAAEGLSLKNLSEIGITCEVSGPRLSEEALIPLLSKSPPDTQLTSLLTSGLRECVNVAGLKLIDVAVPDAPEETHVLSIRVEPFRTNDGECIYKDGNVLLESRLVLFACRTKPFSHKKKLYEINYTYLAPHEIDSMRETIVLSSKHALDMFLKAYLSSQDNYEQWVESNWFVVDGMIDKSPPE
jgi:hypothetical protein